MHNIDTYKDFLIKFKDGSINIGEDFYTKDSYYVDFVSKGIHWEDQVIRSMINSFGQHNHELIEAYQNETYYLHVSTAEKVANRDNHQIWWPKGTITRDWFKEDLFIIANAIKEPDNDTTISDYTNHVVAVFKDFGWKNSRYTVKHFIKTLSQVDNTLNPNTFVECGRGAREGLSMLFDGQFTNKKKQIIAVKAVIDAVVDVVEYHPYINTEAHLCYYWKYNTNENRTT